MCGYIKAHRSFLRWRWYGDPPTTLVFFHCLLKANYYDSHWKDKEVKRGSFITSLSKIAEETGLTVKQVRRAVSNLEKTGEIEKQGTKWTQITICNYDKYQARGEIEGTIRAQSGHDEGTKRATNKEVKNKKNNNTYSLEGFDDFYSIYPRKEKKEDARRAWDKLRPDDEMRALITSSLEKQLPKFSQTERRYIPLPASWINGKRWEDEIAPEQIGTNSQTGREVSEWI